MTGSGKGSGRKMTVLKFTAQASIRHGVSARATADIATRTLIDYGLIKKDDTEQVIGPKKIQRAKDKTKGSLNNFFTVIYNVSYF